MSEPALKGDVVMREDAPATTAIISVIERAATNPNVDIDKMERLLEMQERIMARDAKAAYAAALAAMAPALPVISERGKISTDKGKTVQSTYALWEDVNDAIKPVLATHGFALSFRTGRQEGQITVTGVLSHREGHSEETTITLPHDSSGSKNAVQAVGSSTSYGKRYTAGLLLNLTSRGEDDDGQSGGSGAVITDTQANEIRDLIQSTGSKIGPFLEYIGASSVADIPAAKYQPAIAALRQKAKGAGK
ncbi:MAG: ERF family protein [Brevundimonas sp.]|uniref:ERF family protein n=1 Tax=Brevundimonas sp. TaxID=1871086 RepID=UPI00391D3B90